MLVFIYLRMLICECSGTFYATCYCMYIYCVCIVFCQSAMHGTVSMIIKLTRTLRSRYDMHGS